MYCFVARPIENRPARCNPAPYSRYNKISMRIALGQINTTVGDLSGNVNLIVAAARRASALGADLIAFPYLSITGYPPRDLVEKERFLDRSECELQRLPRKTARLTI